VKVLILGAFNDGALENYYLRGLQLAGADCSCFDIARDYYTSISRSLLNKAINKLDGSFFLKRTNDNLFQFLANKKFDAVVVFKGLTLYASTIEKLKSHTGILSCYNPDHPFKFYSSGSGNRHILESIPHYDLYFTYAKKICEQLKRDWNVESYTIPFGFDDSDGSGYPSANADYKDKWLFIGAWDRERMNWLSQVQEENLEIYGDEKWSAHAGKNRPMAATYKGKPLYNAEYKFAIQNASGVLNLLRRQNMEEGSHNMRTFEVPGYGGLLIANRTEEQSGFFEEDKEAVFFDGVEELNEKLNFLDRNKGTIERIKMAARERSVRSGYGYSNRSRQLFQLLLKNA
jgi:spore maturation protein CgeB